MSHVLNKNKMWKHYWLKDWSRKKKIFLALNKPCMNVYALFSPANPGLCVDRSDHSTRAASPHRSLARPSPTALFGLSSPRGQIRSHRSQQARDNGAWHLVSPRTPAPEYSWQGEMGCLWVGLKGSIAQPPRLALRSCQSSRGFLNNTVSHTFYPL